MRVTGGSLRGRTIRCPPGEIRPSMDRMRESLFSILGDIEGCAFLDLFSGSGVVGIEAASRGATPVVLVERDRRKRATLEQNARIAGPHVTVRIMPAERYLARSPYEFDLVFLDPPFAYAYKAELVSRVMRSGGLKEGGIVIIHAPTPEGLPQEAEGLHAFDHRRYGGSSLHFYRASAPNES